MGPPSLPPWPALVDDRRTTDTDLTETIRPDMTGKHPASNEPDRDQMWMATDTETETVIVLDERTRVEAGCVLVGIDDSPDDDRALAWARRHVAAIGPVVAAHCPTTRPSRAGEMLVRAAADARLLVVGSRGRGRMAELFLGSTSAHCAHHSPVPVVVVPEGIDVETQVERVAVGVDGSDNSIEALRWALRTAPDSARIEAFFSWTTPPIAHSLTGDELERVRASSKDFIDAVVDRVVAEEGALARGVDRHLVEGDPSEVLIRSGASWIVSGARSEAGLVALVVSSPADALLHASGAVVVFTPPAGRHEELPRTDKGVRHVG